MTGDLRGEVSKLGATSRTVVAGPVSLHVLDYGGGAQIPALFLPGITSPAITWDFVASGLTDVVRPFVMDLRGRGLSDSPPAGYGLGDYAEDVRFAIAELALERPLLVGHSLGARIAAAAATEDPSLARGLVAIDPPLSGPGRPYPAKLDVFLQQLREASDGGGPDAVRRHFPTWSDDALELRARWLSTCSEAAIIESHRGFERESFLPLWRDLRGPLTLIYGAESPVVTADDVIGLVAANPGAAVISIPQAGHMVPWENPEDFVAVLRRVLQMMSVKTEPSALERTV